MDVLSKADLLEEEFDEADRLRAEQRQQQQAAQQQGGEASQGSAAGAEQSMHTQQVSSAAQFAAALPGALRVSSTSGEGVEELKGAMLRMLEEQHSAAQLAQQQEREEEGEGDQ